MIDGTGEFGWEVEELQFNRFRKLLVRYEKLERSFMALNHIAAAIIAFRKVKLTVKITCAPPSPSTITLKQRPQSV